MYPKNSASPPKLFATVVKAADGTAITTGVAAKYSTGAGSQAAGSGTCQHEGNGQWSYAPTQSETNVDGFGIQFYHTDAVGSGPTVSVVTTASVVQTGDVYAVVTNGTYGLSALETLVDDLESRIGTPADLGGGATIAQNLADIEAQTDDIGVAGAGLTALPWNASWDAEVQSEATDALNAYDPPTQAELTAALAAADDAVLAAIAALNNLSAAQVNTEVVDVLRTDTIPDSYATDGNQPTIAQAILAIQQFLHERSVAGTTVTVKKPNGSTTAMTFTLDDGTNPTSITRAS